MTKVRRSKFELCSDILHVMSEGVSTPTQLCYRTNMSWSVLYEILNSLIKENYVHVEEVGKRNVYKLTPEGFTATRNIERITATLSPIVASGRVGADKSFVILNQ